MVFFVKLKYTFWEYSFIEAKIEKYIEKLISILEVKIGEYIGENLSKLRVFKTSNI